MLPHSLTRPGWVPPTASEKDVQASKFPSRLAQNAKVHCFKQKVRKSHVHSAGCKAWASECKKRGLNHWLRAVKHKDMQFVHHDATALKGQSKSIGTQKIDRMWKDLKSYLTAQVTAKGKDKVNIIRGYLHTYMYSFVFPKKMIDLWKDTHRSPLQGQQVNKKRICKGRGFWEILQDIGRPGTKCMCSSRIHKFTYDTKIRILTDFIQRGRYERYLVYSWVYRCSRVSPKALDTAALWSSSCESSWVALTADRTGNRQRCRQDDFRIRWFGGIPILGNFPCRVWHCVRKHTWNRKTTFTTFYNGFYNFGICHFLTPRLYLSFNRQNIQRFVIL